MRLATPRGGLSTLPPTMRVLVSLPPADMRCGLDGLAALTRALLQEDPLSGHLFVFFNRRRNRTKILLWDRSGLCLYYKRLEKGVFRLAALEHPGRVQAELEAAELALLLEGIHLAHARREWRLRSAAPGGHRRSAEKCSALGQPGRVAPTRPVAPRKSQPSAIQGLAEGRDHRPHGDSNPGLQDENLIS